MDYSVECILRGRKMKRMVENYSNEIRERYNLKQVELEILYYIVKVNEKVTASDICEKMYINKGQVSKTMVTLIEKKYLRSEVDKKDKRMTWYEVTDKAKIVISEYDRSSCEIGELICKGISQEDMKIFAKVAGQMLGNMDEIENHLK